MLRGREVASIAEEFFFFGRSGLYIHVHTECTDRFFSEAHSLASSATVLSGEMVSIVEFSASAHLAVLEVSSPTQGLVCTQQ